MPRSWTSSPDVHLELEVGAPRGRRAALERALRDAVRDGRLPAGGALPSSRALARDLGLSRGTVVEAYAQLIAEGYLASRPGADTVVADNGTPRPELSAVSVQSVRVRVDLRPGWLDLASTFPRADWLRAERRIFHTAPDEVFDYSDPRGRPELRTALATYLGRARGVVTTPDNIVICAGFAHGLSLLTQALEQVGVDGIAMEDPCNPTHRHIVRSRGLDVAGLPVDESGALVGELSAMPVRAAMLTPAHQYPTGGTLHPGRRAAVVKWARACDGFIIEDDYDGEFRYDRQPVGALQGLDADHVVYAGTTSKTLAPGIRLGWLVLPTSLVDPVMEAVRFGIGTPSSLEQLTFAELVSAGQLDRHLRRLRAGYKKRRDTIVSALTDALPKLRPVGIAAGLHLLVDLTGSGATEDAVRAVAERHSVAMGYLSPYWHFADRNKQGVIIGYARPPAPAFDEAVREAIAVLRIASTGRKKASG